MSSLPLMNPFRYGLFAWQLFSHKLCRWLVPFGMITALVSNVLLVTNGPIYGLLLAAQMGFYGLAIGYTWLHWLPRTGIWRLPSFFVLVNLSILDAWFRYLRGDRVLRWEPSKR
jgi:hypothetical protein